MCKKYIYIVYFLCFFFSYSVSACNSEEVSKKLGDLGLSPTTQHNGNLLANIEILYGRYFVDKLIEKHPFIMKNPTAKIDLKTLIWVQEFGFSTLHSPGSVFSVAPFLTEKYEYGTSVFMMDLLFRGYPIFISRPAFLSVEQLEAIRSAFYDNGNYTRVLPLFLREYIITEEAALKIFKEIYKRVFIDKNYVIGEGLSKLKRANVNILGHGSPAHPNIGCSGQWLNYVDVVQIIKKSGIPADVNIRLQTCFTGIGDPSMINTGKTKEELIDIFINRKIKTLIGDEKNSYGYKFAKEIYTEWPEFKGSVKGYYGMSFPNIRLGYMRNPLNPNTLLRRNMSVIAFYDVNNEFVNFDRAEMSYEYNRTDFAFLK